jgi:hypothetical protein
MCFAMSLDRFVTVTVPSTAFANDDLVCKFLNGVAPDVRVSDKLALVRSSEVRIGTRGPPRAGFGPEQSDGDEPPLPLATGIARAV